MFLAVVMVPFLHVQPVAFLSYSCYRSIFFSAHYTFLGRTFGSRTSSSIGGLISLIGSIGQVGIYLFTNIINAHGGGKLILYYFLPCLVTVVPGNFMLLCWLHGYLRRVPIGDCKELKKTLEDEPKHPEESEAVHPSLDIITV